MRTLRALVTLSLATACLGSVQVEVLSTPEKCDVNADNGDHVMLRYVVKDAAAGTTLYTTEQHEQVHIMVGDEETSPSWNEGLLGMCTGETRAITFPVETMLGLGPNMGGGLDDIKGMVTAEVECTAVTKAADYVIFEALKKDNDNDVLDLIDNHIGINAIDDYGSTPLMVAVQTRKQVVVASLMNAWNPKTDVNYAKPTGHTALFYAIAQKDNSVLKVLLKRGADPNSTLKQPDSLGWTPLHFACRFENVKHAQALLDYGADPLLETSDGRTVLDAAANAPYSVRKKLADLLNEAVARMEEEGEAGGHSEL
mmetsp:Transcript_26472/g.70825  ORF Transcript_26472/g.70825 Transcript_26472/m.70825 type:complete len:312 (-) Transcript_26472:155-1090(-)|eukprot:CAMPEP_0119472072 /NCGR_PEP_ID=MMETSP1344-20130328/4279_1 /TAXON_ID=236787 /ORGANISM="Florenciella parvula, Strain CCMP2471" /LENGTH=311 /DNA_ID=CAMNT_0007504957 /DNA_START=143 /DNA_END=1078 /DNA_ORIENTATION=+